MLASRSRVVVLMAVLLLVALTSIASCTSSSVNGGDAGASASSDGRPCTSNTDCGTGLCIAGTCGFSACSCATSLNQTLPGILPDQTKCTGCPVSYDCANGRCFLPCAGGATCAVGRACAGPCLAGACCGGGLCSPANDTALCTLDVAIDAPDAAVEAGASTIVHATTPANASISIAWVDNPPNVTANGDTATIGPTSSNNTPILAAAQILGATSNADTTQVGIGFAPGRIGVAARSILYCLGAGAVCDPSTTPSTGGCCTGSCSVPDGGAQTVCAP